uniref:Uncharacterized protein n=1 Tax=Candidatus Methanophagaceae archaeon ANME-1 ERB6 TaxID=2759912 RepID=A0A7G9YX08_9EURY|nr:hypothetical protein BJKGENCM_00032 [Methanosarcinales archaeon ANME-1 ERB6]
MNAKEQLADFSAILSEDAIVEQAKGTTASSVSSLKPKISFISSIWATGASQDLRKSQMRRVSSFPA